MYLITLLFGLFSIANSLSTVDIDLNHYDGIWYQTYGDKFVSSTFEKDAYCVYANYTILNEHTVGVYNYERVGSPSGEVQDITGYAQATDEPGQFMVYFTDTLPSPYWIIKVGPVINNQYQYSVVSDPFMLGLYVLARDVDDYYALYDDEILKYLNTTGFTKLYNKPIQTIHDGCSYL